MCSGAAFLTVENVGFTIRPLMVLVGILYTQAFVTSVIRTWLGRDVSTSIAKDLIRNAPLTAFVLNSARYLIAFSLHFAEESVYGVQTKTYWFGDTYARDKFARQIFCIRLRLNLSRTQGNLHLHRQWLDSKSSQNDEKNISLIDSLYTVISILLTTIRRITRV